MSSSSDDGERHDADKTAAESRALGAPRGAGQIPHSVLDRAPGFPSPEPNTHGRARAMTVFSPIRAVLAWPPGGVYWLNALFSLTRGRRGQGSTIRQLSFIHFARWVIIRRFPDHGQDEDLRYPLLLFESNYNGTFDQYIDAFSEILTTEMKRIWGTSYGFPGPKPVKPFKAYIRANEFVADHYYSAYPTATATMINSALALRKPHEELQKRASKMRDVDFGDAYRRFLTDMQGHL